MNLADRKTLIAMLSFSYQTMRASIGLLKFALQRCDDKKLCAYFEAHHDEEKSHDEMVREDLKGLGIAEPPLSHFAAQFAGSQYYLIAHEHPALLLGYMLALESESLSVSDVDALSEIHGVELTAMRHHAIHDPQHKKDLIAIIDEMPDHLRELIVWNQACTNEMIERVEKEICDGR